MMKVRTLFAVLTISLFGLAGCDSAQQEDQTRQTRGIDNIPSASADFTAEDTDENQREPNSEQSNNKESETPASTDAPQQADDDDQTEQNRGMDDVVVPSSA